MGAAEPAEGDLPPPSSALYASVGMLFILPTSLTLTAERRWDWFALSGSVFGGYVPDFYWVGGFAPIGLGVQAHGIWGGGPAKFELAAGADGGVMVWDTATDGDRVEPRAFPSAFLGLRVEPRRPRRPLLRFGAELSMHSAIGLTVSVGPNPNRPR